MIETINPKTLDNTNVKEAKAKTPDLKVSGNGDAWKLLCKASSESEGWMKSTKVMPVTWTGEKRPFAVGCLVQVTTQQRNPDGSYAVAEALVWVPGARLLEPMDGPRQLVG